MVAAAGPGLAALRDAERRRGLEEVGERVVLRRAVGPWAVLDDLTTGLGEALGPDLLGLHAHGSLVGGDFAPARSDIDALAVVVRRPDETMLAAVAPVHAQLERRHPGWRGRVEVETVALSTVEAFVDGGTGVDDAIMRISPGEALHLLPATAHRVLTWASVRERGRTLAGRPAREMLPAVGPDLARDAVLDHVRDWPEWIEEMHLVGGQSYSVLSLCRAWCVVHDGVQLSKRVAADRAAADLVDDAALIRWARDWWYAGGSDSEPGRHTEVRDFVTRTSARILHGGRQRLPESAGGLWGSGPSEQRASTGPSRGEYCFRATTSAVENPLPVTQTARRIEHMFDEAAAETGSQPVVGPARAGGSPPPCGRARGRSAPRGRSGTGRCRRHLSHRCARASQGRVRRRAGAVSPPSFVDSQAARAARLRERAQACSDAGDFDGWVAARDEARALELEPERREEPARSAATVAVRSAGARCRAPASRRRSGWPGVSRRLVGRDSHMPRSPWCATCRTRLPRCSAGILNERRAEPRRARHEPSQPLSCAASSTPRSSAPTSTTTTTRHSGGVASWGDREVERRVRACADHLDAAAAVERTRLAESQRRVSIRPVPDAMATVTALLPVAQAVAVHAALTQAGRGGQGGR